MSRERCSTTPARIRRGKKPRRGEERPAIQTSDFRLQQSPSDPDAVRAALEVHYASRFSQSETWWFEAPEGTRGDISQRGEPWLAAMMPLAVSLGEPLEVHLPVDPTFLGQMERVMAIWNNWYPALKPIRIEAPASPRQGSAEPMACASFFSGGIDSTYTAVHASRRADDGPQELIFIRGFDLELEHVRGLREAEHRVSDTAAMLGLKLITMSTNLRTTRLAEANWSRLAHGPVLAASGLLLGPRYRSVQIASTFPAGLELPLGSHPLVDPLFSTATTHIVQHRAEMPRTDKIEFLCRYPNVLRNLRVCWHSDDGDNCGRCRKCLGVMAALELYGGLRGCPAIPDDRLDFERLASRHLGRFGFYFADLRERALERDRPRLARALNQALSRTKRTNRWLRMDQAQGRLVQWRMNPGLRRLTSPLRPLA